MLQFDELANIIGYAFASAEHTRQQAIAVSNTCVSSSAVASQLPPFFPLITCGFTGSHLFLASPLFGVYLLISAIAVVTTGTSVPLLPPCTEISGKCHIAKEAEEQTITFVHV